MNTAWNMMIGIGSLIVVQGACAGSLTPPAGPVGPSGPSMVQATDSDGLSDTVDDIDQMADALAMFETRTDVLSLSGDASHAHIIDTEGSYYLSGDVVVSTIGVSGILIDADNVTLDLSGCRVVHTVPGNGAYGIKSDLGILFTLTNVVVRDGTVTGFDSGQVRLDCQVSRVENVYCTGGVTGNGIYLEDGPGNMVIGCRVESVGGSGRGILMSSNGYGDVLADCHTRLTPLGIGLGNGAAVRDCTVTTTTSFIGFGVGSGCVLRGCAARDTASSGFYCAFRRGTVFSGCSAVNCGEHGFRCDLNLAVGCLADASGDDGFHLRSRSMVLDCTASDSDDAGFELVWQGNRVQGCHAETVAGFPANYGFIALQNADSSMVVNNTAVGAFDTFNDISLGLTTLFAPDWFNVTLAGPWDNVSQ